MTLRGHDLVGLLANPRRVVVIGASTNRDSPSGRPLDFLLRYGFDGTLLPVNALNAEVAGLPAVASLGQVEHGSVDAALVGVPATGVVPALVDAERIGVKVAVVIGSGFEDRASAARRELDEFVVRSRMRVIGPNCVGTVGARHAAFLTFSSVLRTERPRSGSVGLVTQSGALGNSLLQTLIRRHVGLSQWISSGDEVDVGALELATGLLSQEDTDAVGLFLEGISDIEWLPRLEEVLQDSGKRLFVLKAANSSAGREAAAGHTGRVVGSSAASRAILHEIGAREVPTLSALADALVVASTCRDALRGPRPRVAMVSVSGAAGVIGSDRLAGSERLAVAEIDAATSRLLESRLDARLHPANPLDVPFLDDTAAFAGAIGAFAASDFADVVLAVESGLAHDRQELAAKLLSGPQEAALVLTSLSEDDQVTADVTEALARGGIAYLPTVERAVDALDACAPDYMAPRMPQAKEEFVHGMEWAADRLPGDFPWAPWRLVQSPDDVDEALASFGIPVVLKAAGRTITHRSEVGAVRVLRDVAMIDATYEALRDICTEAGDAVIAQQMVTGGFEVLVSAVRDDEYGPVVFVRPGGTFAETMTGQAVLWGGWPRERRDRVLRESSMGELLTGYRGGAQYDVEALGDLISTALQAVATDMGFMEMNPVLVGTDGVRVVDLIARA